MGSYHYDPAEYAAIAEGQSAHALSLADKIEAGEGLGGIDAQFAASILRRWANNLPRAPKRKPGQAPKFNHGAEAVVYVMSVSRGLTSEQALEEIAGRVGVEPKSIRASIDKHVPDAARMLRGLGLKVNSRLLKK